MNIAPHNTTPAANATGTPAPIAGAGAAHRASGHALATVATPMKNPLANPNDRIHALLKSNPTVTNNCRLQPNIMYQIRQVILRPLIVDSPIQARPMVNSIPSLNGIHLGSTRLPAPRAGPRREALIEDGNRWLGRFPPAKAPGRWRSADIVLTSRLASVTVFRK